MKFSLTGLALLVLGAFPPATYAQAPPGQRFIQIPIPFAVPGVPQTLARVIQDEVFRAAWLRLKQTDLIPGKGQFR